MVIRSRSYSKDKDFESVMVFLAELFEKTQSYENWFPDRFENSSKDREDAIQIWERTDEATNTNVSGIVALTTRDSPSDFFLHLDPNYRYLIPRSFILMGLLIHQLLTVYMMLLDLRKNMQSTHR